MKNENTIENKPAVLKATDDIRESMEELKRFSHKLHNTAITNNRDGVLDILLSFDDKAKDLRSKIQAIAAHLVL